MFVNPDDLGSAPVAWGAFVRYIARVCGRDYMKADVSLLIRHLTPVAWRVRVEDIPPFYAEIDGGDVEKQWQAFSRHLVSRCGDNKGFGILETATVLIHRKRPIAWVEARMLKIHPSEIADIENADDLIVRHLYASHLPAI